MSGKKIKRDLCVADVSTIPHARLFEHSTQDIAKRLEGKSFTLAEIETLKEAGSITLARVFDMATPVIALQHSLRDTVAKGIMYLQTANEYDTANTCNTLGRMTVALETNCAAYRSLFNIAAGADVTRDVYQPDAALNEIPQSLAGILDYTEGPFASLFIEALKRRNADIPALMERQRAELVSSRAQGLEVFCKVPDLHL